MGKLQSGISRGTLYYFENERISEVGFSFEVAVSPGESIFIIGLDN